MRVLSPYLVLTFHTHCRSHKQMTHSSTGIENPEDVAKAIGDTLGALLLGTFLSIMSDFFYTLRW